MHEQDREYGWSQTVFDDWNGDGRRFWSLHDHGKHYSSVTKSKPRRFHYIWWKEDVSSSSASLHSQTLNYVQKES